MPSTADQRIAIRFLLRAPVAVTLDAGAGPHRAHVLEASSVGCSLDESPPEMGVGARVVVEYPAPDGGPNSGSRSATVTWTGPGSEGRVLGLCFDPTESDQRFHWFQRYYRRPLDRLASANLVTRQTELAKGDVLSLESAIRDMKARQFQMLLAGLPILIGLLGTSFGYVIEHNAADFDLPWWVLMVPLASMGISVPLLAVFFQKCASLARHEAFVLLLQRYMVGGSFPPLYRGWHDAYANLNHIRRFNLGRSSPFRVPDLDQPSPWSRTFLPANTFRVFTTLGLAFVPPVGFLALVMLSIPFLASDSRPITVVVVTSVAAVAGLLALCYAGLVVYGLRVTRGRLSFRYSIVQFSRILNGCQMFDPYDLRPY